MNFDIRHPVIWDENFGKLTSSLFVELIRNIERPERAEVTNPKKWYNELLVWCEEEIFWFEAYEYCFGYDIGKARKAIKLKVESKLKEL